MSKPNEVRLRLIQRQTMVITLAAFTLTSFKYGVMRLLNCQRAAGQAITLPFANGKQGKRRVYIGTSITSNNTIIKNIAGNNPKTGVADIIQGVANISGTTAGTFGSASNTNTITLNGSTTGGLAGSYLDLEDVGLGVWRVLANLTGSGTAATPFSNS